MPLFSAVSNVSAYQLAKSGQDEELERLLKRSQTHLKPAILGYAASGAIDKTLALVKNTAYCKDAIQEAAQHQHIGLVDALLQTPDGDTENTVLMNDALVSYTQSMHLKAASDLINRGANAFFALTILFEKNNNIDTYLEALLSAVKNEKMREHIQSTAAQLQTTTHKI